MSRTKPTMPQLFDPNEEGSGTVMVQLNEPILIFRASDPLILAVVRSLPDYAGVLDCYDDEDMDALEAMETTLTDWRRDVLSPPQAFERGDKAFKAKPKIDDTLNPGLGWIWSMREVGS